MFDWLRKRSWKSSPTTTRLLPAYFKIGEYEKGIADCNKALDLGPTTQTPITTADTAAPRWVTLMAPATIFKWH